MPSVSEPEPSLETRVDTTAALSDALRKRPRQRRSRTTVDDLLEAAAQLFEHEGLETTTNRIAERAGYSIGTLYQYFPDKQALLLALAGRHVEEAERRMLGVFADLRGQEPDVRRAVQTLLAAVLDLHNGRPGLHALMYRYAPRPAAGVARVRALHEKVIAGLAAELRRCGAEEAAARRTAALLVHAADAQVHQVLLEHNAHPEEMLDALIAMAEPSVVKTATSGVEEHPNENPR